VRHIPDAKFFGFAHYLYADIPTLPVVKVEPQFGTRKKYSPLLLLTARSGSRWALKLWDAAPHMVLIELLPSKLGQDLGLRVQKYYPYSFERLGASMGIGIPMGDPHKLTWGLISRFIDCFDWDEDDGREHVAESMKRYWKDFFQLMVFQTWIDSRDVNLTNWYIEKKTYAPTRGDFEGTYFQFKIRRKYLGLFTLAKELSLLDHEENRQFYREIADSISSLSLDDYFRGTAFEGFPEWRRGLVMGQDILQREDTYDKILKVWKA